MRLSAAVLAVWLLVDLALTAGCSTEDLSDQAGPAAPASTQPVASPSEASPPQPSGPTETPEPPAASETPATPSPSVPAEAPTAPAPSSTTESASPLASPVASPSQPAIRSPAPAGSSRAVRAVRREVRRVAPQLETYYQDREYPVDLAQVRETLEGSGVRLRPGTSIGGYEYDGDAVAFTLCLETTAGAWASYDTASTGLRETGETGGCP